MKFLQFSQRGEIHTIMLDKADYYKYQGQKLCLNQNGVVTLSLEGKPVQPLHRLIAGATPGEFVKFIDGDSFNLTRENLVVSRSPVALRKSTRDPTAESYSKYRSVYKKTYSSSRKPTWYVQIAGIKATGFTDEETAARYADKLAKKYYGDEAILNFKEDK